MVSKSKDELIKAAIAAQEILRRYENSRITKYLPCCVTHGGRKPDEWPSDKLWIPKMCPVIPCPESKHTKFHTSRARNRVVFGGNRSSKTFTCEKEFVFRMCLKRHPFTGEVFRDGDRHGRILAQDYKIIEKKHLPEMYEWVPTQTLAAYAPGLSKKDIWDKSYDSRNQILHLTKNGWIDFCTYEQDSSKGESVDLDVWFADEEIPEDWYQACNSRIITRNGVGIMGVTPLYGLSWAMRFLDTINPNVEVFKWGIRDNPHNSQKAINDFLADVSPTEREARENGDFIEFKGIRYKDLNPAIHVVGRRQPEPYDPVIMAMDPHPRKGTIITWAYVDRWDIVTFFDEMVIQGDAQTVVNAIKEKEKTHRAPTTLRVADPAIEKQVSGFGSALTTHDEFIRAGMSFALADNSEAGYNVVESYIKYDKTKPLSSLNQPSVYFTEDCAITWRSMTHLMWDEYKFGANRDPKEKVKDKDKDGADCVRYTLVNRPSRRQSMQEPTSFNMSLNYYGL
jgi:phage terminase large subunit-like protein